MPIDKIIFSTQNQDDSDKDLQPGEYRTALNMAVYSDNRSGVRRKNIKGTSRIINFNVSDQAMCVGSKYYRPTNKAYFFFDDPVLGDSIIEYDATDNVTTLLVRNSLFDFNQVYDICVIQNLIYFNDGVNARKINIESAKNNLYVGNFSDVALSHIRKPPIKPVEAARATDLNKLIGNPNIRRQSFQYALRYIYIDNEVSVLSPVSRLIPISRNDSEQITDNSVNLTLYIDKDIKPFVLRVELIVRYGNTGNWFIYDRILPSAFTTVANDAVTGYNRFSLAYVFYNDKSGPVLSDEEALPLFQTFPKQSQSIEVYEDKLFEVATKEEYDLEEENWDASVQLTHITNATTLQNSVNDYNPRPDYLLGSSRYGAGLVFFDKYGRRSAVSVKPGLFFETPANIKYPSYGSQILNSYSSQITATIQATGKPPSWAYWVQPVRTNNLSYQWWYSKKCRVQFPKSLKKTTVVDVTSDPDVTLNDYYIEDEYEYFNVLKRLKAIVDGGETDFPANWCPYIDISIPQDFPFTMDDDVKVVLAFPHPDAGSAFTANWNINSGNIIARFGNKIRINNPLGSAGLNWKNIYHTNRRKYSGVNITLDQALINKNVFLHLMFFRERKELSSLIDYEVGELIPVQNPGESNRSFPTVMPIHGDCYSQGYRFDEQGTPGSNSTDYGKSQNWILIGTEYQRNVAYASMSALTSENGSKFLSGIQTDQGKPNTNVEITEEKNHGGLIRYTDSYVPDSFINGFGVMRAQNKFQIPSERGAVIKLIGAGDNTLLAIHARKMTSLYVNIRMLRSPNGQDTLVQSDDVIGQQRPLSEELGTVNPESIVSVDDFRIYGFDFNAAEPWRKSNDGITPLATQYKRKKWFKEKCDELKAAKAIDSSVNIKIVGGFDPYLKMFFLTFKEVQYNNGTDTITILAETVGFSELGKGWIGNVSFIPESYTSFGNNLYTVKNQKLWKHNVDEENHNMFYDVQYSSEIQFVSKLEEDKEKVWSWIGMSSNSPWKVVKIENPSGQLTDIDESLFKHRNDMYYADILRDVNTPVSMLPAGKSARQFGVEMISQTCTFTLRNSEKNEVVLDAVYIGYNPLFGHLIQPK